LGGLGRAGAALTAAFAFGASPVSAEAPKLQPPLAGLTFLLGSWSSPKPGDLPETGGSSSGTTSFTPEAGGAVLWRKDHVALQDAHGQSAGGFDIVMMIYAEDGRVRGEYADGTHVIHYTQAKIDAGREVEFTTPSEPGRPAFRLAYALVQPGRIAIRFSVAPPGETVFQPIAVGVADKQS
jgi:hypothetical protein